MRVRRVIWALILGCFLTVRPFPAEDVVQTDVCVYGGTSGGIAAALQAARMGKRAVIAEFSHHLGGLTTGGLGATDIGNKAAIGGIAREFYERIYRYYEKPEVWRWEEFKKAPAAGQERSPDPLVQKTGRPTRWVFEPHVALKIYREMLEEAKVPVYLGQRLAAVKRQGARITEIRMANGRVYRAQMFIDASYEGDLMAKAGVSFHVGREANATYGETLNGVRAHTPSHQFLVDVDPYLKPGDPKSGLLPYIQPGDGGRPGEGDGRVQAYNFRLCMTQVRENMIPWKPPKGYDPAKYELLARLIEAHEKAGRPLGVRQLMNPVPMPNGKTDTNNNGPFSTDFIGMNYDYPNGDYAQRARLWKAHEEYTRGFLYFLATSPRLPKRLRDEMNSWGLAKDEFTENGGWPSQLYVREARRMTSDYVMTEHNCRGTTKAADPIGLGAYNMDSHNCQRLVQNGVVKNEGDVQVGVSPYGISYRSIVPKAGTCENLFVPVCLAASHIAYGSIRMEPVFMILGQSAATAAVMAIDARTSVQKVDYTQLRERLLADGQVLEWIGPTRAASARIDPKMLKGLVMDDTQARLTGHWRPSSAAPSLGPGYLHDGNEQKGECTAAFQPDIPKAGLYEIFLLYPPMDNRASKVPVTVAVAGGETKVVMVNQKKAGPNNATSLGRFQLPAGKGTTITVSNEGTDGHVIVDGVQLAPVDR